MFRLSPVLAIMLFACHRVPATISIVDADSAPSTIVGDHPQPQHLLLPWGTTLLTAPRADAIALRLGTDEDGSSGRAVAVIGREGDFWQLETLDDVAVPMLEVPVIEGLDFYRLRLYVPIGVGEPIDVVPPVPEAAPPLSARAAALEAAQTAGIIGVLGAMSNNPPVQTGELRSSASQTDFRVAPATVVYWADGREAGEVRREHAFVHAGELRSTDAGELRCFAIRVGLAYEPADGELCFASTSVQEVAFVPEVDSLWGDVFVDETMTDAFGGLIGDGVGPTDGLGGLGLTGSGDGGGGGYATIGTLGHGGGGSGGGSSPDTKIFVLAVSGLDDEVGGRIVRAQRDELEACWVARGQPSESVQLELVIDAAGKVADIKAKTTDVELARCIETAGRAWTFPAQAGSLVLKLEFVP